jgi:hypothetical protein
LFDTGNIIIVSSHYSYLVGTISTCKITVSFVENILNFVKATSYHVYTKMGPIVIVGFINVPRPKEWIGTKIHVNQGNIVSPKCTLPRNFGNYLLDRARNCEGFYSKISKRQAIKINEAYDKDIDNAIKSKTWEAMAYDVDLFGDKAFTKTNKK